jgi:PAS domain S-box-containing protein
LLASSLWFAATIPRGAAAHAGAQARVTPPFAETSPAALKDAESRQRDYRLAADPGGLAPVDSPKRTRRFDRSRQLATAKFSEPGGTMTLREPASERSAPGAERSALGQPDMDAAGTELRRSQADAEQRLPQARMDIWSDAAWLRPIGFAVLASLLLGWVALVQRKARLHAIANLSKLARFTRAFGLAQGMMRGKDGRISFWGEGDEQLYGYTADQALGRLSHDLLATEFDRPLREIEADLLRDGRWQGVLLQQHRDGSTLHVMTHWVLYRGEHGEADAVIEVHRDITSLRRVEALLHTIIETAPALIYAKDRQGRMLIANKAALELIGVLTRKGPKHDIGFRLTS